MYSFDTYTTTDFKIMQFLFPAYRRFYIRGKDEEGENRGCTVATLFVQGVATSIDALSVGFTIAEYNALMAVICALIIAAVTFVICMGGRIIGKKFGMRLGQRASVFGGVILILIGIEIFLTGIL